MALTRERPGHHDDGVTSASFGRIAALLALTVAGGACQLAYGLGDYEGATAASSSGVGGYGAGASASGGASTTTTDGSTSSGGGGHGGATTTTPKPGGPCECAPALDEGWTYVYAFHSAKKDVLTDCGKGVHPTLLYEGSTAAPVQCEACKCADPAADACAVGPLRCATSGKACEQGQPLAADGSCQYVTNNITHGYVASCQVASPPKLVGGCAPSGGGVVSPPPEWPSFVSLCPAELAPEGKPSCASTCVLPVQGGATCLAHDGKVPCPSGLAPLETWKSGNDARSCTACGCDASGVGCSGGGYAFYFDGFNCTGNPLKMVVDASCVGTDYVWGVERVDALPTGSCGATGGQPTGAYSVSDPMTVCCPK